MEAATLIHSLVQQLSAVYARESDQILLEQLGIGYSQFKILSTLQTNPATQQKHIALQLGQTEASISRQVKLLLAKGLLVSNVNPANKREHITELTMKGVRITDAAQKALDHYQEKSLRHLSGRHLKHLAELLQEAHGA